MQQSPKKNGTALSGSQTPCKGAQRNVEEGAATAERKTVIQQLSETLAQDLVGVRQMLTEILASEE